MHGPLTFNSGLTFPVSKLRTVEFIPIPLRYTKIRTFFLPLIVHLSFLFSLLGPCWPRFGILIHFSGPFFKAFAILM